MDLQRLRASVKKGEVSPVYLVFGSDTEALDKVVRFFQTELCPVDLREWCVTTVDGREIGGADVVELVSTPPFLGDRRVVVVRSADRLDDQDAIIPLIDDPPDFAVLVLVASEVDKRRKLYQAVRRKGRILQFDTPEGDRLASRIREMCRESGIQLDEGALQVLIERAGDDLERIRHEIDKLKAYAGGRDRVTEEEARNVVARGLPTLGQYAIFDFVDAVAEGRRSLALTHLDRLLRAGEPPLLVLGMIARQLRMLVGALGWQGQPPQALADALGLKSTFPARKSMTQARLWDLDRLAKALEFCVECDRAIKSGTDGRLALEMLTVRLSDRSRSLGSIEGAKKSRGRFSPQL